MAGCAAPASGTSSPPTWIGSSPETGIVPAVNQVEIHPYFNNAAPREACARHDIAVEAHSPLGRGGAPLSDPTIAAIDGLDQGADGRVGPDPDTYEGV